MPVRPVAGQNAVKAYRCPWCQQEIAPGTPHVVAWLEGRAEDRRHWHTACWRRHGGPSDAAAGAGGDR